MTREKTSAVTYISDLDRSDVLVWYNSSDLDRLDVLVWYNSDFT